MKKILLLLFSIISLFTLANCRAMYRVYNDEDLESLARENYSFTSILFFKIIDAETAFEFTGESYNNSGIIYGVKSGVYTMLFVPKLVSKEEFILDYNPVYNVIEIYQLLSVLEDEAGGFLFQDSSRDYGGLSISVSPYDDIKSEFPELDFESPIFFIVTTDDMVFNIGLAEGNYRVFDQDLNLLN